jgi:hypothetical protein
MKKISVLVLVSMVLMVGAALAQGPEQYIEMLRSDLKTERVAIITEAMDFTPEEGEVFWPIYREYELDASKIGDRRIALIKEFAANFDTMTNDVAEDLIKTSFKINEDTLKLEKKYIKKYMKVLPAKRVARYAQIDHRINMLIDIQIAASLPLFE